MEQLNKNFVDLDYLFSLRCQFQHEKYLSILEKKNKFKIFNLSFKINKNKIKSSSIFKHMGKKNTWSIQEDQILASLIISRESQDIKIKWTQISTSLNKQNPSWHRTGYQCRQRWLNILKPRLEIAEQPAEINLQQLFNLIRLHGKKWSLIAQQLPGQTAVFIKNFFYAALRKGLRNLNFYNTKLRSPRKYKVYKQDIIDKLLSVHDQKKNKIYIDQLVYKLADGIRENLIICSRQDLKSKDLACNQIELYETLSQNVIKLSKMCRYKKYKLKKQDYNQQERQITIQKSEKGNNQAKIYNNFSHQTAASRPIMNQQIKNRRKRFKISQIFRIIAYQRRRGRWEILFYQSPS